MKLSDVMGAAGLSAYAEVALVLFFAAFALVVFQVVSRSRARDWDEASRLPLCDSEARSESPASAPSTEAS
jgi:hypothetical protein